MQIFNLFNIKNTFEETLSLCKGQLLKRFAKLNDMTSVTFEIRRTL